MQHAMTISVNLNKKLNSWWSPQLHNALLVRKYWLPRKTKIATGISMKTQLSDIIDILPPNSIAINDSTRHPVIKNLKKPLKPSERSS